MRFLSTDTLKLPRPMTIEKNGSEPRPLTLPEALRTLLNNYAPTQNWSLTVPQLRSLNKTLDKLDGVLDGGYYLLDEAEFTVALLVVQHIGPLMIQSARNTPAIEDALMACPENRPVVNPEAVAASAAR